jgi:hypothetical protein
MCLDILSTGFGGAETGRVWIGDIVAIFAQSPIWLCPTAAARRMGGGDDHRCRVDPQSRGARAQNGCTPLRRRAAKTKFSIAGSLVNHNSSRVLSGPSIGSYFYQN